MKIDVSKIAGFADMSPEDKVKALSEFEIPDPDYTGYVKKEALDKASSEAAEWKRKHNALLSEDEKKKQEATENLQKMEKELAELRMEKTVSEYTAQFITAGYSEALAKETAKAMADGDMTKVFANQQKFISEHDKAIKSDLLKGTPKPGDSGAHEAPSLGEQYAKQFNSIYENKE